MPRSILPLSPRVLARSLDSNSPNEQNSSGLNGGMSLGDHLAPVDGDYIASSSFRVYIWVERDINHFSQRSCQPWHSRILHPTHRRLFFVRWLK
jgi:hypothetical protein